MSPAPPPSSPATDTTLPAANGLQASFGRCQSLLWQAAGISVLSNLLLLTGPLFMLQVYDRILTSRSVPTLVALFGLVTALFAFYGVFDYLRGRLLTRLGARVQAELDTEVFQASVRAAQDNDPQRRRLLAVRDLEYLQQWFAGLVPLFLCCIVSLSLAVGSVGGSGRIGALRAGPAQPCAEPPTHGRGKDEFDPSREF